MFYKNYHEKIINKLWTNIKILKEQIEKNDDNARQHWENQRNLINEIAAKQNMLVDAFNEQRVIIAKLVAKMNKKAVKTTKKSK